MQPLHLEEAKIPRYEILFPRFIYVIVVIVVVFRLLTYELFS